MGLLSACGDSGGVWDGVTLRTSTLALQPVAWNASQTKTGKVAGVAEVYEDLAVFGDQGVQVFSSGVLFGSDTTIKAWLGAALVPAGDLSGDWAVGVSADGRLMRLRNRTSLEDVSARYGLRGTPLTGAAALGQGLAGFAYDKGLAVADGDQVTRFDGSFSGLSGGGGRAVAVAGDSLRVLSPKDGASRVYQVPGLVAAVLDPMGKVVAATKRELFLEVDGALQLRFRADADLRGLASTTSGVWALLGDSLALWRGDELLRGPAGALSGAAATDPAARLIGSPSGDVWLLSGGALSRFSEDDGGGQDKDLWRKDVLPMFSRLCAVCHLPNGSSGIDLSTYASWASRRALVQQRVLTGKPTPMPPAGAGKLTTDETTALKEWLMNKP